MRNKAGYTATSCGRVGRSGNARFHTFRLVLTDGPTDRPTDGWTDKASYRVTCPQLKTKTCGIKANFLVVYLRCWQCWPKDIRYSLSSDIRIKMVVIFILSFFYSKWSNNHLIFILSFHFLGIILFEKIRITSNNHSFFKMGKNVIS